MVKLSDERIKQILHEETLKKEDNDLLLRSIYSRNMRLYEEYFADIDALNNEEISRMRAYNEETQSLIKYYYLDIPMDVCTGLREFDKKFSDSLLGPDWRRYLFECFDDFREEKGNARKNEKTLKAEFSKQALSNFYDAMDYVFRDGFGTASQTAHNVVNGITGLLFGNGKK